MCDLAAGPKQVPSYISHGMRPNNTTLRFLVLWGGLAVVAFGISGLLTAVVVWVNRGYEPAQDIAAFGSGRPPDIVTVAYSEDESGSHLNFSRLRGVAVLDVPGLAHEGPCHSYYAAQPRTYSSIGGDFIDVRGAGDDTIACDVSTLETRESYFRRRIDLNSLTDGHVVPRTGSQGGLSDLRPAQGLRLWFSSLGDAEDFSFSSASEGKSVLLKPGWAVEISYASRTFESRRDVLLVVIGSLIALGAAMLLEAIRPFVEMAVGRTANGQTG